MEGRARRALLDIGLAAELVLLPVFDQSQHPKALTNAPDRRMPPTLGAIVTALESNGTALPEGLTERIVVLATTRRTGVTSLLSIQRGRRSERR